MSKKYTDSLSKAVREHYIRKLQCLYGVGVVGELRDEKCPHDRSLYKAMAALTTNICSSWAKPPRLKSSIVEKSEPSARMNYRGQNCRGKSQRLTRSCGRSYCKHNYLNTNKIKSSLLHGTKCNNMHTQVIAYLQRNGNLSLISAVLTGA